jgi:hypothetical protein
LYLSDKIFDRDKSEIFHIFGKRTATASNGGCSKCFTRMALPVMTNFKQTNKAFYELRQ